MGEVLQDFLPPGQQQVCFSQKILIGQLLQEILGVLGEVIAALVQTAMAVAVPWFLASRSLVILAP